MDHSPKTAAKKEESTIAKGKPHPFPETFLLDGESLIIEDLVAIARDKRLVALAESAKKKMQASRDLILKKIASNEVVYGITTGF